VEESIGGEGGLSQIQQGKLNLLAREIMITSRSCRRRDIQ
jgi:hypothetical protein